MRVWSVSLGAAVLAGLWAGPAQAEGPVGLTFGAGPEGAPSTSSIWDFEAFSSQFVDPQPSCSFSAWHSFGDSLDSQGWVPSPESVLPARVEMWDATVLDPEAYPGSRESADVGGGVLAFDAPEGYPPFSVGWMESPVVDLGELGLEETPLALSFSSNSSIDPEVNLLQWLVGIRVVEESGEWSEWWDVVLPVEPGPAEYSVELPLSGALFQVRIGLSNPTDTLIRSKTKADKAKGKQKPPVVLEEVWKYVPDIQQDRATCAAASTANCLAYWASNGYPEIIPSEADEDTTRKHRDLREDLEEAIYGKDKKVGGDEEDADNYPGGIGDYLEKRGVAGPMEDGRPGLEHIYIDEGHADWDTLKAHFDQGHDVLLVFGWYDKDGNIVTDNDGKPLEHQVTMAGRVRLSNGKTVIHVANPWGEDHDEVNSENREEAYESMEVEIVDGKVRLKNEEIQKKKKRGGFLCLRGINVVRPRDENGRPYPSEPALASLAGGSRPATLGRPVGGGVAEHSYAVYNPRTSPIDLVVLMVQVDYFDVEAPPGWGWSPLPELYPGSSCTGMFGLYGIVWRTTTDPILPGESLSGFRFHTDASVPVIDRAVQFYEGLEGYSGVFGHARGPVPQWSSSTDGVPVPTTGLHLSAAPNPATTSVALRFDLGAPAKVSLEVFDAAGRRVRTLVDGRLMPERHEFFWDRDDDAGRALPSGVYFSRLRVDGQEGSRRLVVVR